MNNNNNIDDDDGNYKSNRVLWQFFQVTQQFLILAGISANMTNEHLEMLSSKLQWSLVIVN